MCNMVISRRMASLSIRMLVQGVVLLAMMNMTIAQKEYIMKNVMQAYGYNIMASDHAPYTKVIPTDVSPECETAFAQLLANPTVMIYDADALGKPAPGALVGNLAWIGHYDECRALHNQYCLVQMHVNGTSVVPKLEIDVSWGVCVPPECSAEDVKNEISLLAEIAKISDYFKPTTKGYAICPKGRDVGARQYDAGFIGTVTFCCTILLIILVCALLEAARRVKMPKLTSPLLELQTERVFHTRRGDDRDDDDVPLIGSEGNIGSQNVVVQEPTQQSIIIRLIQCFSLTSNLSKLLGSTQNNDRNITCLNGLRVISMTWVILGHTWVFIVMGIPIGMMTRLLQTFSLSNNMAKLLDSKQSGGSISCLNGMRVISMFWVILGHTLFFGASTGLPLENPGSLINYLKRLGFQAILNATFSVDTFFFLSGLLVGYLTFMRMAKTDGKIPWFWFYFHRFWRLTPVYMFTILFFMYIAPYMGKGPFWMLIDTKTACEKYWWTNLLYINNFYPKNFADECIGWSWYLANDMQFFIVSPIFLVSLFMFPIVGVILLAFAIVASFIVTGVIVGYYNLPVFIEMAEFLDPAFILKHPPPMDFQSMIYGKPYCRIAPYLVGIVLGYFMYRIGNKKVRMNPIAVLFGWLTAAAIAILVLYGNYPSLHGDYTPSITANIIYAAVSRFAWTVSLAWIVFACKYGYGGWINDILSWSGWTVLSRLTYTAYLVHPIVIIGFYFNGASAFHFSIIMLSVSFVGCLGISYGLAAVFSLLIEFPFANLEKLFMPKDVQSKRTVDTSSTRETIN